jgi:osmoprotectant transport system ATP-binding protein
LMDEPFGALDPIIRANAQDDLLAIQKRFKTTIVLVTHDMDEAMRLGDMIAVMDAGRAALPVPHAGRRARPATRFVDDLVGTSDRPFRLLSLRKVRDVVEAGSSSGAPIDGDVSLREAYAHMLWRGTDRLPVTNGDGEVLGIVTLARLGQEAAQPT